MTFSPLNSVITLSSALPFEATVSSNISIVNNFFISFLIFSYFFTFSIFLIEAWKLPKMGAEFSINSKTFLI